MSRGLARLPVLFALTVLVGASCRSGSGAASSGSMAATPAQSKPGPWKVLFDGKNMDSWRGYKMQVMPKEWSIVGNTLTKAKTTEDILTKEQYADFEFEAEWKLEKGGNSGIFYHGSEEFDRVYWSAPEYQLLDDANAPDGKNPLTSAASAYGLYAPPRGVVKPAGEWNTTRIIIKGPHVEHWLNGQKVVEYELWSPDWEAKVKASKFSTWAKYGRGKTGYIAIQGDHNGALTLRNMRIRTL